MADAIVCATCAKTESDLNKSLKHCAKCSPVPSWALESMLCEAAESIRHCSREYQQQDWKVHKNVCASKAASTANNSSKTSDNGRPSASADSSSTASNATPYKNLQKQIEQPFHKLSQIQAATRCIPPQSERRLQHVGCFLLIPDSRPGPFARPARADVGFHYMTLIFQRLGDIDADFLEGDQVKPLRRFLSKAEKRSGLLPDWWSKQKTTQCILYGKHFQEHSWATMSEKSDIMEYYGNRTMPMQLRMLVEQVYGSGPGRQAGAAMMEMIMKGEQGTIQSVLL